MPTFRDALLKALTGSSEQQLHDESAMGRSPIALLPDARNLDKATHALASKRIARRFGSLPAQALGGAKELAQGAGSVLAGGSFFGPNAYDAADIEANFAGIDAAQREDEAARSRRARLEAMFPPPSA